MKLGHVFGCCKGSAPHPECNAEMCMRCATCIEHQIFCAAAGRRKANGIRLRRLSFMADASQVEAFNLLFEPLVKRFGKIEAVDVVIASVAHWEASFQDLKQLVREMNKEKRRKSSVGI